MVSAPAGSAVSFGRIDVDIREGESVFLQYSLIDEGSQLNWNIEYLYDGNVARLERSGSWTLVTGIKAGECLLQTVSLDGIKDAALITVRPGTE